MSNIYAVVQNGVVVNIAVWDGESEWNPSDGVAVLAEEGVGVGWSYDGKKFIKPASKPDAVIPPGEQAS
ncbi:TPA: hypothetical protein ACHY19_003821 [Escherichia coli]|uniref:hypothetical protein n=1 Tax=Escherichia coli TaxID=562 RepID=UPI0007A04F65|nr:hypothetical protein [Escherichia coli]EHW2953864.1 hypothetical protein [Escherichia coli]EIQ9795334.1 hypothetical protein [Escherichia coli]EJJ5494896.1 hypothetical protein [Escherichia coli]KYV69073.1 hypothetical protein AMK83_15150 [Escherichia coli]HAX2893179.1 hypothetical protein [Escherichia coli]